MPEGFSDENMVAIITAVRSSIDERDHSSDDLLAVDGVMVGHLVDYLLTGDVDSANAAGERAHDRRDFLHALEEIEKLYRMAKTSNNSYLLRVVFRAFLELSETQERS